MCATAARAPAACCRSLAELGLANVVARSAFICQVDADRCTGCELCLERCQFNALAIDGVVQVDGARCVGCGVCTLACPDQALILWRRPEEEVKPPARNRSRVAAGTR